MKAKKIAQSLISSGSLTVPVDVRFLAEQKGISIKEKALEDNVSGMLVIKDEQPVIAVNASHHQNRRRFTIAHELGHYFLHRGLASVFFDETLMLFQDEKLTHKAQSQEIEANAFAAELLMPEQILREKLSKERLDALDDSERSPFGRFAAELRVSRRVLTIRLTRLGLIAG